MKGLLVYPQMRYYLSLTAELEVISSYSFAEKLVITEYYQGKSVRGTNHQDLRKENNDNISIKPETNKQNKSLHYVLISSYIYR